MQDQIINYSKSVTSTNKRNSHGRKNKNLFKMHTLKSLDKNKSSVKQGKSKIYLAQMEQQKYRCKIKLGVGEFESTGTDELERDNFMELQSVDIVKYVQQKYKISRKQNKNGSYAANNEKFITEISEVIKLNEEFEEGQIQQPFTRYNSLQSDKIRINNLPTLYGHVDKYSKTQAIQSLPFNFQQNSSHKDHPSNQFAQTNFRIHNRKEFKSYQPCQLKLYNDFILENHQEKKQTQFNNSIRSNQSEKRQRVFRLTQNELNKNSSQTGLYQSMYASGFKQRKPYLVSHNLDHFRKKLQQHANQKLSQAALVQQKGPKLVIRCNKFEHVSFQSGIQQDSNANEDGLKRFIKMLSNRKKTSRTMKAEISKNSIYHVKLKKNKYELFISNSRQTKEGFTKQNGENGCEIPRKSQVE